MGIDPISLAAMATVGSGVMGAVGSIKQGQAADAAAESQANVMAAESEARLKAAQAKAQQDQITATQQRAMAQRTAEEKEYQARELIAKERAAAAASGGGTGGSAAAIIGRTAAEGQYQSDLELAKGEEAAKGTEYQSILDLTTARTNRELALAGAEDKRKQGKAAKTASYWGAGSQILGAVGQAASAKMKASSTSSTNGIYY